MGTKRASWRKYVEETESAGSLSKIYKALSRDKSLRLNSVKDKNGLLTQCPQSTLEVMANHHVPAGNGHEAEESLATGQGPGDDGFSDE